MTASRSHTDSLDRTACRLVFTYGGDAAIVAYTKAVACEVDERIGEAQRWRGVLGRVVAIDDALQTGSSRRAPRLTAVR